MTDLQVAQAVFVVTLILGSASLLGLFCKIQTQQQRQPEMNLELAMLVALAGTRITQQQDGIMLELQVDSKVLKVMLPQAQLAVDEGLLSLREAAKMVAEQCCATTRGDHA